MKAKAFWIVGAGRGELREEELPAPGPDEALVRTRVSAISRGTEALVLAGRVPAEIAGEMRAPAQAGEFPWPVKYGYACVGLVEDGPPAWRGKRVFGLWPHQDAHVVPVASLTAIPDAVPDTRAALAANLETAVNGLWDGRVTVGDRVTVVGAGSVGLAAALIAARVPGADVEVVDTDPARRALAANLGVRAVTPEAARPGRDRVLHASGRAAGLATAIALAGFEARVLELSWYGAGDVPAPLGGAFHARRLRLVASQVGHVPADRGARWSTRERLALTLDLLDGDDRFDALVGVAARFDELPARYAAICSGAEAAAIPLPLVVYGTA